MSANVLFVLFVVCLMAYVDADTACYHIKKEIFYH